MLDERPRLFFMHFWANDDAVKLAKDYAQPWTKWPTPSLETETVSRWVVHAAQHTSPASEK